MSGRSMFAKTNTMHNLCLHKAYYVLECCAHQALANPFRFPHLHQKQVLAETWLKLASFSQVSAKFQPKLLFCVQRF